MGAVPVGKFGIREGPLAEREVRNGVVALGQVLGPTGEDEPKGNGSSVNMDSGSSLATGVCINDGLQIQPQGPIIRWERFLPVRSLKVLLVENDDSTRHVVSALLRNCSYEVTAVADGLQAWKVLEDQSIDLVLTEVVMPFLSGIVLLCKIMSHKSLKNIPVIMMSSHDSMGLVFKCLSKGAVDFLVKPIRKNELKNLWQHIWRRCRSSSASASESGTQTKKSAKSTNDESENNTCSSDYQDNGSNGLGNQDGSDNGSGTQSSWTKRIADVDSPQPMSPLDQSATPDSTCAQVIHAKPEADSNKGVGLTETKEYQEQIEHGGIALGRELKIEICGNRDSQCQFEPEKLSTHATSKRKDKLPESDNKPVEKGQQDFGSEIVSGKSRDPVPKETSEVVNSSNKKAERECTGNTNGLDAISNIKDEAGYNSGEMASLELTLKSTRVDGGPSGPSDRNILRHSDLSAFSKYNTASSANQIGTGNVGSCSPMGNGSTVVKTETVHNYLPHSTCTPPNQQSNGSSNNMASSNNMPAKPEGINEKPEAISSFRSLQSSAFLSNPVCSSQPPTSGVSEDVMVTAPEKLGGSYHQIQMQHHYHHHHHYYHYVHRVQQDQQQADCDDVSLKNMAATTPQCGSSTAVAGPTEGNSGNCSVNGSISGSNQGSNGQNGGSTVLNTGVTKKESDHGPAGNSDSGGKVARYGADEDRVAHREAALTKFRQKRKERCFEKRVRYQSRKRLAEQRPRMRGQFVRQIVSDARAGKDGNQSSDLVSEDNSCDSA